MKRNEHSVLAMRWHLKLTQVAFARLLGVHSRTVTAWENGDREPDSWQRNLLALLHLSQPRPNLEERLTDKRSNPVLVLAHLLSDHVRPSAQTTQMGFIRPPAPLGKRKDAVFQDRIESSLIGAQHIEVGVGEVDPPSVCCKIDCVCNGSTRLSVQGHPPERRK